MHCSKVQVISFYSWDEACTSAAVVAAVSTASEQHAHLLRWWHVERVPRSFNASFQVCCGASASAGGQGASVACAMPAGAGLLQGQGEGGGGRAHKPCPHAWLQARWRRYLYLLPLRQTTASAAPLSIGTQTPQAVPADVLTTAAAAATAAGIPDVDVARVHALLQPLVGQCMNYTSFARDTPAGKDCTCRLLQARAWRAALPGEPGAASSTQRALPCNIAFCPVLVQQPACW